jgi:hypothetical protein
VQVLRVNPHTQINAQEGVTDRQTEKERREREGVSEREERKGEGENKQTN